MTSGMTWGLEPVPVRLVWIEGTGSSFDGAAHEVPVDEPLVFVYHTPAGDFPVPLEPDGRLVVRGDGTVIEVVVPCGESVPRGS